MVTAMSSPAPVADGPARRQHKGKDGSQAGRAAILTIPEGDKAISPSPRQPVPDELRAVSMRGLPVWWKLLILARRNCRL